MEINQRYPVIRVEHLFKSFGKIDAVADLSFDVRQGEIFGFLGPNGESESSYKARAKCRSIS